MKKIIALIAALSLFSLTACGQGNYAATLGEITISQKDLQSKVDEVLKAREGVDTTQMQLQTGGELNRGILGFEIITTIFEEIAKELKLEITTAEITKASASLIQDNGGTESFANNLVAASMAESTFPDYVRAILVSDKLSTALQASGIAEADVSAKISELVTAKAKELKITVNPRYGKWDDATGTVVAADSAGDAVQGTE